MHMRCSPTARTPRAPAQRTGPRHGDELLSAHYRHACLAAWQSSLEYQASRLAHIGPAERCVDFAHATPQPGNARSVRSSGRERM